MGSVKDIHFEAFAIDTPGTNTYRHRQAGAELVTARGLRGKRIFSFPSGCPWIRSCPSMTRNGWCWRG